ncbi:PREDICTED: UDP-glycosyltransferase 79B3-like [Camelina sativa]|uniref:UDP-glycosyltransferase 79B3-like n=1 Tax=Camelina sativa TaxID=90675 RepID=A0ABM0V5N3_CAMSA|nr:PREDICTED: UDP-glycosyltransferase 79B3-like [Camelina sativa]
MLVLDGELGAPPPGYPSSKVLLCKQDAYSRNNLKPTIDVGPNLSERFTTILMNCDVVAIRTARKIEGNFCDYIKKHCRKKVLLTGPMFPEPDETIQLDERRVKWLSGFEPDSVVFCALGSQIILEKDQFQELCLGMELTGSPFLVAVKPPRGSSTIQEALSEGFEERVKGRGGFWGRMGSTTIDIISSKESLRDAINSVMKRDSEIRNLVKKNHTKWRETLVSPGIMTDYVDNFLESLKDLVSGTNHDS